MRAQCDLHVAPRVRDSGGHLRLCSCRIRAGSQPDQSSKIELAEAAQFCPVEPHRLEDLGTLRKLIQRTDTCPARGFWGLTQAGFAAVPRGVRSARTAAATNSARTSPQRCPMCSEFTNDCTAMIPPCTTLDHTVNQMRLKCASGLRDATNKNTPSVA